MQKTEMKENKMGVMPVNKLLVTMALPIIISMLAQALYNVVDSFFVAQTGREALTAVSQAFSAQNLIIGIATGTGVGVNALLSKSLGEKKQEKANLIAKNGVFLAFVGFVIIFLFGLFGTDIYFRGILSSAQLDGGLDLNLVRQYGNDYLRICCLCSFGIFGQIIFERLMQATGRTIFTLFTQGVGAIINIILDPIFVLEKVPILHVDGLGMGAAGAAIATVIGQVIAFILAVILNLKFNHDITLSFKKFRPHLKIIRNIYSIGIPSIIMVAIGSIMFYLMNIIIMSVSSIGATIFGVYFKLQSFVFMPLFGLNNGIIPIIAYNYGARKRKRMTKTIKLAIFYACCFMAIGLLLMQIIPDKMLGLFEKDPAVIELGCIAMRRISLSFVFAGACIIIGSVFQALGYGTFSMFVSIARQLVVLVPVAWLLSKTGVLDMIWWSVPIAEIASVIVSGALFIYLYRKVISKVPEGQSLDPQKNVG